MKIGYIPLHTPVIYRGWQYETRTACSRAFGTIGIMSYTPGLSGPDDGYHVKVEELEEIREIGVYHD